MKIKYVIGLVVSAFVLLPLAGHGDPVEDFEQGERAIVLAHYEKAIRLFGQVVEAEPDNAEAWHYIGYSFYKQFRYPEARDAYLKTLEIDPDHRRANENLGQLYLQTDQLGLARERLIRLDQICFFGCDEFDNLKAAIDSYESR